MCFEASYNICKECRICPQLLLLLVFLSTPYEQRIHSAIKLINSFYIFIKLEKR